MLWNVMAKRVSARKLAPEPVSESFLTATQRIEKSMMSLILSLRESRTTSKQPRRH